MHFTFVDVENLPDCTNPSRGHCTVVATDDQLDGTIVIPGPGAIIIVINRCITICTRLSVLDIALVTGGSVLPTSPVWAQLAGMWHTAREDDEIAGACLHTTAITNRGLVTVHPP